VDDHSKTLISIRSTRLPDWVGIPARVFAVTFVGTLLSFAVSLLLAILGTFLVSELRGVHPDVRIAYRYVALPAAGIAALVISIMSATNEIRLYHQNKALKAIERMS
jgi:TRAP-type C4-dicarboxylate transport system permease small subunit